MYLLLQDHKYTKQAANKIKKKKKSISDFEAPYHKSHSCNPVSVVELIVFLPCQEPKSHYEELIFNLEINSEFYESSREANYLTEEYLRSGRGLRLLLLPSAFGNTV